jgi:hypothetical protein
MPSCFSAWYLHFSMQPTKRLPGMLKLLIPSAWRKWACRPCGQRRALPRLAHLHPELLGNAHARSEDWVGHVHGMHQVELLTPPRPTASTSTPSSTSLSTWAKYQVHVPVSCLLNLGWDCHQCELQIYIKIQYMKILFAYVGWDCHQCELQIYSKILHMKILFAYVVALFSCICNNSDRKKMCC